MRQDGFVILTCRKGGEPSGRGENGGRKPMKEDHGATEEGRKGKEGCEGKIHRVGKSRGR